jgi:prevent-host-death family protein
MTGTEQDGMEVSVEDARSQFVELIELVERGHHVVISREGAPIARLVPFESADDPDLPARS